MSENLQPLNQIISVDDLPKVLGFLKEPLNTVMSKLKVSDILIQPYNSFNRSGYWVKIRANQKLSLEVPGVGLDFVLNPNFNPNNQNDYTDFSISLVVDSKRKGLWEGLNIKSFSGNSGILYGLFLDFYGITESDIIKRVVKLNYNDANDFILTINNQYQSNL